MSRVCSPVCRKPLNYAHFLPVVLRFDPPKRPDNAADVACSRSVSTPSSLVPLANRNLEFFADMDAIEQAEKLL